MKDRTMSKEQNFLIRYGLHNFVSCPPSGANRTFVIKNLKNKELVSHARYLIKESFGEAVNIHVG